MLSDLGARLLRAGLLTRGQLGDAIALSGKTDGSQLAAVLIGEGLSEDALAGFFLSLGFGPLVERHELETADPRVVKRLPLGLARAFIALPLYEGPDGIAVAMADPTDATNIQEVSRVLNARVLPRVARLRDITYVLTHKHLPHEASTVERDMSQELAVMQREIAHDDTTVELVRRKVPGEPATLDSETTAVGRHPELVHGDEEVMPLVRQKPVSSTPASAPRERTQTYDSPIPLPGSVSHLPRAMSSAPPGDTWSDMPTSSDDLYSEPTSPGAPPSDALYASKHDSIPVDDSGGPRAIDSELDAISITSNRDDVIELACKASLSVCRTSMFFAVKKDVIQGRAGCGGTLSNELARTLSIPLMAASNLRTAALEGLPYLGPLGSSPADSLYGAVVGARVGEVMFQPVTIGGKTVGLLCAESLRYGDAGPAQLARITQTLSAALSRIIKSGKKS